MTQSEVPARIDPQSYNRAASECELIAITLMKATFEVQPQYYDREQKKGLSYDTEIMGAGYLKTEKALSAHFKFSVHAKDGRKSLLKCVAEYYVLYEAPSDLEEDAALAFCTRIGLFAAFPYFRSWVAQASWASNANLPPVPSISSLPAVAPLKQAAAN